MKCREKGFVLIVCLVFLAIISLVAVFMFNGFVQDERSAGNNREKNRAIDAAQTGVEQAADWMSVAGNLYASGVWNQGVNCSGTGQIGGPSGGPVATVVCNTGSLSQSAVAPNQWNYYNSFTPSVMTVSTSGGANNYAGATQYSMEYIGTTSIGTCPNVGVYKVTSAASGGNADAVAVVQANYSVEPVSCDSGS